jgi:hypothetical protein
MSKQTKRINKIKKNPKNALVVGSAFGELNQYVDVFSTTFVWQSSGDKLRRKTVVYRDTVESLNQLAEIDFIFIDKDHFAEIKNLHSVWRKSKSVILTQGTTFTEKALQKFLNSEHYYAVEVTKQYMIWKTK